MLHFVSQFEKVLQVILMQLINGSPGTGLWSSLSSITKIFSTGQFG